MIAHISGFPIEETLAACGPVLLTALGACAAQVRAWRAAAGRATSSSRPVAKGPPTGALRRGARRG